MVQFGPKHRKIPVPRRHGVRDPLKRLAEKEAAIKDKINNPPKEHDVQEVSNRFKRFVQMKEQANKTKPHQDASQRKKRNERSQPKMRIGSTTVAKLPKESETAFLSRVTQLQEDRAAEIDFGVKFGVEVERDDSTGALNIRKWKGAEVDAMLKNCMKQKEGKGGKPDKRPAKSKKLTIAEKKALKKQKALDRKNEEDELLLKEYQYDYVPFGEVVKGPPTLHTLPRRANKQEGAPRPASKRLLLHSLMNPQSEQEEEKPATKRATKKQKATTKVDLKGKRKKLPLATRMQIEKDQQSVVEMYRKLKKKANQ